MTGAVFREWIRQLNRDMRAAGRNILLLVDNASSHKTSELTLSNVNVQFLPPNTTAFLQPMDAGIIATFKKMYRKKQLKWVYDKINSGEPIEKDAYDVDQLQAMQWCDEIWSEMQKTAVIKSCFCHTGIIFRGVDQSSRAKKTSTISSCSDVGVEAITACASAMHI
ncbi:hypothetical protein DVH05_028515 [Phytophthora capsici]|nr:hypothetical protein DVH05_028515 [Phytophthora capsici]